MTWNYGMPDLNVKPLVMLLTSFCLYTFLLQKLVATDDTHANLEIGLIVFYSALTVRIDREIKRNNQHYAIDNIT